MNKKNHLIFYYILLFIPAFLFNLEPAKFPADDGFFYPQITYNIVQGNGVTFNKIFMTNGFHPLWLLICTFLAFINMFEREFLLNLIWLTQFCLFTASLIILSSFFKGRQFLFIIGAGVLSIPFIGLGTLYLNEAHLNLFFLSLLLYLISNEKNWQSKHIFFIGLIFGLTILTRLDNIFIVATLLIFLVFSNKLYKITDFRSFVKHLSILILSLSFPVVIYFS